MSGTDGASAPPVWAWESEDKKFRARVERVKPYVGRLVVEALGDEAAPNCRVLDTQEVAITMDHRFGPDHQDLLLWQEKAMTACGLRIEDDE